MMEKGSDEEFSPKTKDWKFKSDIKFNVAYFILLWRWQTIWNGYTHSVEEKWTDKGMTLILAVGKIFPSKDSVMVRYFIGLENFVEKSSHGSNFFWEGGVKKIFSRPEHF